MYIIKKKSLIYHSKIINFFIFSQNVLVYNAQKIPINNGK